MKMDEKMIGLMGITFLSTLIMPLECTESDAKLQLATNTSEEELFDNMGFYDNNVWSPIDDKIYKKLPAELKLGALNQEIQGSVYKSKLPFYPDYPTPQDYSESFADFLSIFTTCSDVMKRGRPKAPHAYGVTAPFNFIPVDGGAGAERNYTGLFQEGTVGILR